jgi:ssDNA-specific exonuclease RecJ
MVVFKAIREPLRTNSLYSLYDNCQLHQVSFAQFLLCLKVFEELHLLTIVHDNGLTITFNDKKKVDLTSSKTYNFFNLL